MRCSYLGAVVASVASSLLVACAGNGNGLDANGRPVDSGGGGSTPLTADFDSIQQHVFTPICTACHVGAGAPQGLRLDAANSYGLLVGVASQEQPSLMRVKAGDPSASYLVQKLEGRAAVGGRMPLGGPYLDQATIDVIRQWITDGALPSPSGSAAIFAMAAVAPASGEVLDEAPARIVAAFTRELDRTRVDDTTVRLERLDSLDAQASPQRMPVEVAVPDDNPSALLVTPRAPLAPGRYRFVAETSALTDLSGMRLAPDESTVDADATLTTFDVREAP
jgi:hypothetical protein